MQSPKRYRTMRTPSQRLPKSLEALSDREVKSWSIEELMKLFDSGAKATLCAHSSNRGLFCVYVILPDSCDLFRVSSELPLRTFLRRKCKSNTHITLLPANASL